MENNLVAYYGTLDTKVDISNIFIQNFLKNDKIIIPKETDLNTYFGDPCFGVEKKIFIKANNTCYAINEKRTYNDLEININTTENILSEKITILNKIKLVYFVFINQRSLWKNIVGGQLLQLNQTGLLDVAQLYVHIVCSDDMITLVTNFIKNIVNNATIYTSNTNQFEYRGIHLVWKLATEHPEDIYLYFHSKGMSYNGDRTHDEQQIFQEVICPWKKVINIFNSDNNINKIGLTASVEGWLWFNFWWARGSYLSECEEPIISTNRYYYEDWLHRKLPHTKPSSYRECYSLADDSSTIHYVPGEACAKVNSIVLRIPDFFFKSDNNDKIVVYYGTIDYKINVTSEFIRIFKNNGKINIPARILFNSYFGDPCIGKSKNIFLEIGDIKYIINENNIYNNLIINTINDIPENIIITNKIKIVYFAFINFKAQWKNIVGGQLNQLKKTGLLDVAQLYIHIVCDDNEIDMVTDFIRNIIYDVIIYTSNINQFEYRGIHLVWKLAKEHPEDIYLYFHSKGMVNSMSIDGNRSHHEQQIFQEVICPWKKVINIFNTDNSINKIGLAISKEGWAWCNFWWARGTYLAECEEPIVSTNRWYYEDWLHRKLPNTIPSSYMECYGLADDSSDIYYGPGEARARENSIVLRVEEF